ncbi:hypothetical protein [Methanosarcina sp. WH1]
MLNIECDKDHFHLLFSAKPRSLFQSISTS